MLFRSSSGVPGSGSATAAAAIAAAAVATPTAAREAAAQHREISSVLCDCLGGWDGEGGREGDARGKRNGNILYMYN